MKRYIHYCRHIAVDHILDWGLGDWCHVSEDRMAPRALTSSAYYYVDCKILSQIAKILGQESDAAQYSALAEEIRNAINERFYNGDGQYASGEQTAQACALYQDIADHSNRDLVGAGLLKSIMNTGERLDIGILGAKYLLRALSDIGETELAYGLLTQTDERSDMGPRGSHFALRRDSKRMAANGREFFAGYYRSRKYHSKRSLADFTGRQCSRKQPAADRPPRYERFGNTRRSGS